MDTKAHAQRDLEAHLRPSEYDATSIDRSAALTACSAALTACSAATREPRGATPDA